MVHRGSLTWAGLAAALSVLAVATCRSRGVQPSTSEKEMTTVEETSKPAAGKWGIRSGGVGPVELGQRCGPIRIDRGED